MPTALITGCDYGIGFEFARQYAADGWQVHAVGLENDSREKVRNLPGDINFHHLDVSDQTGLAALTGALSGQPIDLLINNAATFAPDRPGTLMLPDMDEFTRVMPINAVAPVYIASAFEKHVAESDRRLMGFIGTRSGSIGDNTSSGYYAYRCSKAAPNMAVKSLSIDLAARGVITAVLHPGSVATETRNGGPITVNESVSSMRRVIDDLTKEMSGAFLQSDGGTIEW